MREGLKTFFHLSRFHIIAIASLASLTFGWLFSGHYLWLAPATCALDWFIVNLQNRVVDLEEDRLNGIAGTDFAGGHARAFTITCFALLAGTLALGHLVEPRLTLWRVAFQLIGLAYNFRILPGRTRFKELYLLKNLSSGVLFILSTMVYPAVLSLASPSPLLFAVLVGFFLPLEITYEIIYDLRDVAGDRQLRVPTFPVVHGIPAAHGIIWALLATSAASLAVGAAVGVVGLKEGVLVGGVVQQALYFQLRIKAEPTAARCIFVTYLGAAQIGAYHLWIAAGLPISL